MKLASGSLTSNTCRGRLENPSATSLDSFEKTLLGQSRSRAGIHKFGGGCSSGMALITCCEDLGASQVAMERCDFGQSNETLSSMNNLGRNLLYDILRRVDAVTLAKVSCVNHEFRCVANDEILWKDLCNEQWPSTRDSRVQSILSSAGGYRMFYSDCYPCIVSDEHPENSGENTSFFHHGHDQSSYLSPSDMIFIVDVVYGESSVFSKIVEGMAGSDNLRGHSSSCPFHLDLMFHGPEENIGNFATEGLSSSNVRSLKIMEGSLLPTAAFKKLRLSWILINKRTGQMANLASWKPLSVQNWLSDGEFLLKFGTVLPGMGTSPAGLYNRYPTVRCNIPLVCSLKREGGATGRTLKLAQISFHLEDYEGSILSGEDTLKVLQQALTCPKTTNYEGALDSYHHFVEVQDQVQAKRKQDGHRLNVVAAISSAILYGLLFLWLLKYLF